MGDIVKGNILYHVIGTKMSSEVLVEIRKDTKKDIDFAYNGYRIKGKEDCGVGVFGDTLQINEHLNTFIISKMDWPYFEEAIKKYNSVTKEEPKFYDYEIKRSNGLSYIYPIKGTSRVYLENIIYSENMLGYVYEDGVISCYPFIYDCGGKNKRCCATEKQFEKATVLHPVAIRLNKEL